MRRTAVSLFVGALAIGAIAFAHPASASPWLGVYSQDISPELREGMNYNGSGALVTRVVPDSPADRGGIERGDVIVSVGGRGVDSPSDLVEAVGSSSENASVEILVVRDGSKKSLRVRLASRPEGDSSEDEIPMPNMPRLHGMQGMPRGRMEAPEAPDAPDAPEAPRAFSHHSTDSDDGDGSDMVMRLPELLGGGMMGRARLGVRMESLNPDLAAYFGSRDAKGALVLDVVDGSPAEKAGIRAGDVILRVDSKTIESAEDLTEAVRSSDQKISVSLLRHGARQTVGAELGDAPNVMRFRGVPQGLNWKSNGNGKTWEWQGPDGKRRVKQIIIDGDDDDHGDIESDEGGTGTQKRIVIRRGQNGDMKRPGMSADHESTDQLREEIQQLREELDQLRKELESNH